VRSWPAPKRPRRNGRAFRSRQERGHRETNLAKCCEYGRRVGNRDEVNEIWPLTRDLRLSGSPKTLVSNSLSASKLLILRGILVPVPWAAVNLIAVLAAA
jgi:hypothetical protein